MTAFIAPERYALDDAVLRCYLPGDGPALQDASVSSYTHLKPWMSWAQPDQTAEEAESLVRSFRARYLLNEDFTVGIWSADETRLLGGTGFHRHGGVERGVAEVGMWIRTDAAGRGLGTAVLEGMLRWGFTDWPWERLAWHCDQRNTTSARVAEKAGMRHEGSLRGDAPEVGDGRRTTLIYGLTRADLAELG